MHDILKRLGVDGLEHAVDRGLGDRDGAARLWVAPRPHGLELCLSEGTGAFRGRDTALHVGAFRQHMDREDAGDRVLTSLCPAKVGNLRELRIERAQCRQILRRAHRIGGRPDIRGTITGPGEQPLQILAQRRDVKILENAVRVGIGSVCTGKTLCLAQMNPVGGGVHRTRNVRRVAEGLGQNRLATKARKPVLGQASGHLPQDEGGDVRQHTGF